MEEIELKKAVSKGGECLNAERMDKHSHAGVL